MSILLAFLLLGQKGFDEGAEADRVAQRVLKNFLAIDNIHIKGNYKIQYSPKAISTYEYEYFRSGPRAKYFQKTGDDKLSLEDFANEEGHFKLHNDYDTGRFSIGSGTLSKNAAENLGLKFVHTHPPLIGITGNFAITETGFTTNPSFSFQELLTIGTFALREDDLNNQKVWLLQSNSPWGVVKLWVDKKLYRPFKVEATLKSTGLLATGVTLAQAQKGLQFKTLEIKDTYFYTYPEKGGYLNLPAKITQTSFSRDVMKQGEISGSLMKEHYFDTVEPFHQAMAKNFVIASKAANGTPFPIHNQPQIAYHLEDGQLVRSANYKLINQISSSLFGSVGFWYRLSITVAFLLAMALAGFWMWRRWRPIPI